MNNQFHKPENIILVKILNIWFIYICNVYSLFKKLWIKKPKKKINHVWWTVGGTLKYWEEMTDENKTNLIGQETYN